MSQVPRLDAATSTVLVIDVQDKLMPKIVGAAQLIRNIAFLVDAAALAGVPVRATEQYPKGLGPTVPELARRLPNRPDKLTFSCCGVPGLTDSLRADGRTTVLLAGIEAHVCVLNTAVDLLAAGFTVFVAADAVGSRATSDADIALRRLEASGATLTTVETAAFEWMRGSDHPNFKKLSALVQERMKGNPS